MCKHKGNKVKKYFIFTIFISLNLSILLFFTSCAKTQEQKELQRTDNSIRIRIEGVVFPQKKQDIISAVAGYIQDIYVKNGDRVKKGDIIYSLDKELIKLDIENKKMEISTIKQIRDHILHKTSTIDGSVPAINLAARELRKVAYLKSKGYVGEFEANQYEKNYINALYSNNNTNNADNFEKLKNLNKQLASSEIELKKLKYQLNHADAYASMDGFVAGLNLSKRESIGTNRKICSIVNLDKVIVKAGFATGLLPFLHKNQKIAISFVTTPPYKTVAKISKINPIVDKKFDRMTLEAVIPNHNYILQEGTRVLITVPLSKKGQAEVKKYFLNNPNDTVLQIKSQI